MAGERPIIDPEQRVQHARELAWAALNRREHTVAELGRALERRRVAPEDAAVVLDELVADRYLDDADYARRFTEDRRHLDGWGSERIERRLRALGVGADDIRAAVGTRGRVEELEAALTLLRQRFPRPPADPAERNRMLGALARKGFELELAYDAVRRHAGAEDCID